MRRAESRLARWRRLALAVAFAATAVSVAFLLPGCGAHMGRLQAVQQTLSPMNADTSARERGDRRDERDGVARQPWQPLFGDTAIGLVPGTADSARRYLGRLRNGYTTDTLNIILVGDNRPGWRMTRLAPEYAKLGQMFSLNPVKFFLGLVTIPWALVKGLYPDLGLLRDIPGRLQHMPTWGREVTVLKAMTAKVDSLKARGEVVAAVINTGDLVNDGRYPAHWDRFLRIIRPLSSRVPYFPIAGNHERIESPDGIANWRTATGLPVGGDRLYYCFDSADGWVRFIALDSNPMTDPSHFWTREVQVKYSGEEINWMMARLKEHRGPAFIFMHHPPFSVGFHHVEWQADSVLRSRRAEMMQAMREAGIAILAAGHEHGYQRAVFTWPDAVLINLVTGGGGAPLHTIPSAEKNAQVYSEYNVAGAVVKPENVVTGAFNHFIHVRLWFGGGEIYTYAVDHAAKAKLVDNLRIDLTRYGTPKVDQHKMPIPVTAPVSSGTREDKPKPVSATRDSVATSKRILSAPTPRQAAAKKPAAATRPAANRDSLKVTRKPPAPPPPNAKQPL